MKSPDFPGVFDRIRDELNSAKMRFASRICGDGMDVSPFGYETCTGVEMKLFLKILFGAIFLVMVWVNVEASRQMNLLASFPLFGANPWAVATLYDAYCGFLTFYVWVAYKEQTLWARGLWFVL